MKITSDLKSTPQAYRRLQAGLLLREACLRQRRLRSRKRTVPKQVGSGDGLSSGDSHPPSESLEKSAPVPNAKKMRVVPRKRIPLSPEDRERKRLERLAKATERLDQFQQLLDQMVGLRQAHGSQDGMKRLRQRRTDKTFPSLVVNSEVLNAAEAVVKGCPFSAKVDRAVRAVLSAHHEADYVHGLNMLSGIFHWLHGRIPNESRAVVEKVAEQQLELFSEVIYEA